MVLGSRSIIADGAVGEPLARVRAGYVAAGSGMLVEGQDVMKALAIEYVALMLIGVLKTLAIGISPTAPRVAD